MTCRIDKGEIQYLKLDEVLSNGVRDADALSGRRAPSKLVD